jgi:1-aminocyclopropane-1-carboxylate deaminase/D-cysteine desulfhydrase-like pyridoxal-dependent ACC family enzyme
MTIDLLATRLPEPLTVGLFPTPLYRMVNLERVLDGPQLFVKREDLSGLAAGGNKARKLAALIADAKRQGATVVLTQGGLQSNHCAQTACAAAMHGLGCELVLAGDEPGAQAGNLRIDGLAGAVLHFVGAVDLANAEFMVRRAEALRLTGEVPYVISLGGSDPVGTAGYVSLVDEIVQQLPANDLPTHIVIAAGSLGSLAGVVLGSWLHNLDCRVDGVSVLWSADEVTTRLDELIEETRARFFPSVVRTANYAILDDQVGSGYGQPTEAGDEAAQLLAQTEGMLVDATYTAKALAGLIAGCRSGRYGPEDRVLFVHTGGLGGFFA